MKVCSMLKRNTESHCSCHASMEFNWNLFTTAPLKALLMALLVNIIFTGPKPVNSLQCENADQGFGSGYVPSPSNLTCVSLIEANQTFLSDVCLSFIPEGKCFFPVPEVDFVHLNRSFKALSDSLQPWSYCTEVVLSYACNYVYPGCSEDSILGICFEDCSSILSECSGALSSNSLDLLLELGVDLHCGRTNNMTSNSSHTLWSSSDCFNISDTLNTSGTILSTTDSVPLELIIPVSVVGGSLALLCCAVTCIICCCCTWRAKRKRKSSHFQPTSLVRENKATNIHELRGFLNEVVEDKDEMLPMFKLLSEDADRLGRDSNLRNVLIPFKRICFIEEIAKGAFGCVYRGVYLKSYELVEVAIKTIKDVQPGKDGYNSIRDFIEESALMYTFNHPHVLGLIGISLDENRSPYIIIPYMDNGDLRTFLKNKREVATKSTDTGYPIGLQYDMLVRICHEIAQGMEYLASRRLVHRDLAARNCMVDRNFRIKVADFGLTRDIYQSDYYIQRLNAKIPVKWMSPESLNDRVSNEKTDVWAYGVTCWEVFSLGRMPYPTVTNHEMLDYLDQGFRLKQPALCSDEMFGLMTQCWQELPANRPEFAAIVLIITNYIIPESCTPTIGKARYKANIREGSHEENLLNSIINELKYTPADIFDEHPLAESQMSEQQTMNSEVFQAGSYLSMCNSYYVKMNPILEGVVGRTRMNSYENLQGLRLAQPRPRL